MSDHLPCLPLPLLAAAIRYHERALPKIERRYYSRSTGYATIVLHRPADMSAEDFLVLTRRAKETLIHCGFITSYSGLGSLRVSGYYGTRLIEEAGGFLPIRVARPTYPRRAGGTGGGGGAA